MHTVYWKDLKPGMITAADVVTKQGQLIVDKNKILTNQMIQHIEYYGIAQVAITDVTMPEPARQDILAQRRAMMSHAAKVRRSREFKEFKESYEKKVDFLEGSLNDFIVKNVPLDKTKLLQAALDLFIKDTTTISMFDMLHNMRKINDSTFAHSMNVAIIGRIIGMWLGYSNDDLDALTLGGLLHDIGKCLVPEVILNKPGKLTAEEYVTMKMHTSYGYQLIKSQAIDPRSKLIVLNHHERSDGSGYPAGLHGNDIDDFSIITAIADVYDAMTSDRIYRSGMCPFEVIAAFEHDGLNKYKPLFITTFLEHIANTYANNDVLLSNGLTGKIVLIDKQHLTRPVIQMSNNKFINLQKHPEIYVQAII